MGMLPDAETFKRLVADPAPGPAAIAARWVLAAGSVPYGLAVGIRGTAYDLGILPTRRLPVPVISVGNLTVGGTGKTPLVAWVARRLAAGGRRPAVVSRGYAARPGEASDEALELRLLLPGIPHVAARDRVAGGGEAADLGCDAIVLDDGFQHRRLHRDLDIVAIDATDPFGCGHLLPRGLLREPLRGLARADAVVLTRATAVPADRRAEIRRALAAACGGRAPRTWIEAEHRPVRLRLRDGTLLPLGDLRGMPVAAFAGIGNPAAFRATLADLGADVVSFEAFPDHHAYRADDLARLARLVSGSAADMLLTTLKDLVRIPGRLPGDVPLAAIEIALEPVDGAADLAALVASAVAGPGASRQ